MVQGLCSNEISASSKLKWRAGGVHNHQHAVHTTTTTDNSGNPVLLVRGEAQEPHAGPNKHWQRTEETRAEAAARAGLQVWHGRQRERQGECARGFWKLVFLKDAEIGGGPRDCDCFTTCHWPPPRPVHTAAAGAPVGRECEQGRLVRSRQQLGRVGLAAAAMCVVRERERVWRAWRRKLHSVTLAGRGSHTAQSAMHSGRRACG